MKEKISSHFPVLLTVTVLLFLCGACKNKSQASEEKNSINVQEKLAGKQRVSLPFSYLDWIIWSSDYYSDKGVANESLYVSYKVENEEWLSAIFPESSAGIFYVLENNRPNYFSLLIEWFDEEAIQMTLLNIDSEGNILSEMVVGKQYYATGRKQDFKIEEINDDLFIHMYEGDIYYDEETDTSYLKNKKVLPTELLTPTGRIYKNIQ